MADTAAIATLEGEPVRATFPLHVVMFGVPCVCIPEARYRELLSASAPPPRSTGRHPTAVRLSRLDKDVELRTFIADRIGTDDLTVVREAAIQQFGAERVPSKSAIHEFAKRIRAGVYREPFTRSVPGSPA